MRAVAGVEFKDLCLDARDGRVVTEFWGTVLGLPWELQDGGDGVVRGGPLHALWVNEVPEPKTVKNRVHLDLWVPDLQPLLDLGATVLGTFPEWTVLADPEGNELCAFPGDAGGALARPFAICIDSARPVELARWWHALYGGELGPGPDGRPRWLRGAAGAEDLILKHVQVDDPRVVKNRCHWDVTVDDLAVLLDAGATVLRPQDDEIAWTVLADPDGNELCAFLPS